MDDDHKLDLPEPALYLPMSKGKYDVAPGLTHLSAADFGNGIRDGQVFQIDREFPRFRANKQTVRGSDHWQRHSGRSGFTAAISEAVTRLIVSRLVTEHPRIFSCEPAVDGGAFALHSALTGETLQLASDGCLIGDPSNDGGPGDALSALCDQFQEDVAVVHRDADGADRIVALDIRAPSHWAPEEKLGGGFDVTHQPVPGMERLRAAAGGLVNAMIERPPTARFTWGIEFSDALNQHPAESTGARAFDPGADLAPAPLYLRVERQTTWGLPDVDAALFVIRVYIYDLAELIVRRPAARESIASALRSMSAESRLYKGLPPPTFESVLDWLDAHTR